mmetsp:Transcript_3547/g.12907  ORF Transcript_3547/g.12907 Transcript_3547/m.12907 type:complete len:345 (-) Transcript_3547:1197-2231(-)
MRLARRTRNTGSHGSGGGTACDGNLPWLTRDASDRSCSISDMPWCVIGEPPLAMLSASLATTARNTTRRKYGSATSMLASSSGRRALRTVDAAGASDLLAFAGEDGGDIGDGSPAPEPADATTPAPAPAPPPPALEAAEGATGAGAGVGAAGAMGGPPTSTVSAPTLGAAGAADGFRAAPASSGVPPSMSTSAPPAPAPAPAASPLPLPAPSPGAATSASLDAPTSSPFVAGGADPEAATASAEAASAAFAASSAAAALDATANLRRSSSIISRHRCSNSIADRTTSWVLSGPLNFRQLSLMSRTSAARSSNVSYSLSLSLVSIVVNAMGLLLTATKYESAMFG